MTRKALAVLDGLKDARVLALGDLMLDRYIYGEAVRLSPEAPVPVISVRRRVNMPGGLGNVLMNLASLGLSPLSVGIVGEDSKKAILECLLRAELGKGNIVLLTDPSRPTTVKTRLIAGIQQVARYDEESLEPVDGSAAAKYLKTALKLLPRAGTLSLSDYGKGLLTPSMCGTLISAAEKAGIPVVVDPKGSDWERYSGASLVTPNRQELSLALGRDVSRGSGELLAAGAKELMARHRIKNILVTRSEDGMTLVREKGEATHLSARARAVFDVSGAGDTVVSVMAAALAAGASLQDGAELATLASGVVVGKVGTSTASPEEIRQSAALEDISRED
ncbi:MAG: PfkB family carbohydrate kinase [Deltaproteobacteria bacterium]|jgi:D-beta-D-heptose 7-phosphate kinase/D-beta-D-heptose 1-phosphate adenosyltransferase|nr:PfkB family carbohydrate kinase [Deltaproteobacteria bacterium]